jgi:2-dehydro-3-deoxyphosphogluconate aldolase/(4S)-4-hydroxy-2-oxoglutarate aldolase
MSINIFSEKRIVPVVSIKEVQDAVPLAEALLAGGLDVLEITFRTPAAELAVRSIAKEFPKMRLGAGTLLEHKQLAQAQEAGAQFGVAPGLNRMVIEASQRIGFPFIPGVMTPSEVESGLSLGCKLLKFFPANLAGGIPMLQALAGPYSHTGLKFVVLGGVSICLPTECRGVTASAAGTGGGIAVRSLAHGGAGGGLAQGSARD